MGNTVTLATTPKHLATAAWIPRIAARPEDDDQWGGGEDETACSHTGNPGLLRRLRATCPYGSQAIRPPRLAIHPQWGGLDNNWA